MYDGELFISREDGQRLQDVLVTNLPGDKFYLETTNYGKSFRIIGKEGDIQTNLWIRIEPSDDGHSFNLNNIELAEPLRGKGYLTKMVLAAAQSGVIGKVAVTTAISPDMRHWCEMRGMEYRTDDFSYHMSAEDFVRENLSK